MSNYRRGGGMKRRPINTDNAMIDYKDLNMLKSYLSDSGKIIASRVTGLSAKSQRLLAKQIKRARFLALIPYCDHHKR